MTETILPHELPQALEHAPAGVKLLSLDCFDTLLWRDCHAPSDLFAGLSRVTSGQRMVAETHARKIARTLHGRNEVGLAEIYAEALPNADKATRAAAIAEELALEARHCFAFGPTVALMRAAKAQGLGVIIVSDTYLDADELHALIAAAAGAEVAGLIDRIFASSQIGISKGEGLLAKAVVAMRRRPHEVLHIGDNLRADHHSARALGIPALHLVQFSKPARQRLRFERSSQQLIGDARNAVRGLQPHRAILAQEEPQLRDPAAALGFTVLGPVFTAFDSWLRTEAAALEAERGGCVHWLFMLRDGHLPHLVHEAVGPAPSTARVEISRFVGIAASLTSREAYTAQMAREYGLNPSTLARQMLFTEAEIAQLVGDADNDDPAHLAPAHLAEVSRRLLAELRKGQRQTLTRKRARARAARLVEHVRRSVDPKPGDTLMLVDLGYNGSAQDRVAPILAEALGCHVAGRYLLLREMTATGLDKRGLIDARHYDAEMLEALCGNVAVIEQLATCALGSVIDFTDVGEPIRKASSVKGAQSDVRDAVQDGVLRFAKSAQRPPVIRRDDGDATRGWREAAAAALTRFMFLPQPCELAVLKSFEHDVNLGSERMVALFDSDHAHEGMRRRGLFYMKGSERMFLPAELAGEDINTRLSLMVQMRFGLGISYEDYANTAIAIPAIYLGRRETSQTTIEARPTHEGFYVARLPLPRGADAIAVQMGSVFEWFELAGVTLAPIAGLKGGALGDVAPITAATRLDRIVERAGGIHECTDPAAFMLVFPPASGDGTGDQMIEIAFRPLRRRAAIAADAMPLPLAPEPKEYAA